MLNKMVWGGDSCEAAPPRLMGNISVADCTPLCARLNRSRTMPLSSLQLQLGPHVTLTFDLSAPKVVVK